MAAKTDDKPPTPPGVEGTHNRLEPPAAGAQIGKRWRELQGANDWKGLLNPLDEDLRAEIIRYGEFAEVTYDAFDFDKHSQYCGSCKYSKKNLFKEVELHNTGYIVTRYIYATANVEVPYILRKSEREDAWSSKSNWMGYVAVSTDPEEIKRLGRRDIMVVWRGTQTGLEWAANFADKLIPAVLMPHAAKPAHVPLTKVKVEAGFFSLYTSANPDSKFNQISAQDQLQMEMRGLVDKYKNEPEELSITICGHSLGSALATLSAYDFAESGFNKLSVGDKNLAVPITVFSFAGPRVGNSAFKKRIEEIGVKVLRMVNVNDKVPRVPGVLVNENVPSLENLLDNLPWTYSHVGVKLELNDKHSKHLNQEKSASWTTHNLEVYLHLVDGYGRYDKLPIRDLVLVNKRCGFLKDDKFVPEEWWQLKNKGLQYFPDQRRWYQPPRALEDVPVPPKQETIDKVNFLKSNGQMNVLTAGHEADDKTAPITDLPKVAA
ncbi:hypothetical protein KC19_9G148200 [Ceratodon purpureus]|uniref:Fungal lipase-type domain-containing protein n=1 Tax=Ceratodon purpureus TaxID=3225 RepID=A0A8T0GXI0_CERPU|nr:hypothetical protein KC19_9G148200 [Ceratodon purpureus]